MASRTSHGGSPTKRSFLAAGLGLSGTALLAACGKSADSKRPALVVWHSYRGREKTALEEVAALYSA
ncbi:MAG: hypothetical protein RL230_1139, partial [Pseudomonadota bacterium]